MNLTRDYRKWIKNQASLTGSPITVTTVCYALPSNTGLRDKDWEINLKFSKELRDFLDDASLDGSYTLCDDFLKFEMWESFYNNHQSHGVFSFITERPQDVVDNFNKRFGLTAVVSSTEVKPRKAQTTPVYDGRKTEVHAGDKVVFYNRSSHSLGQGEVEMVVSAKSVVLKGRTSMVAASDIYVVESQHTKITW